MAHTILYIATSEDGFIADKHGNVDWLPMDPPQDEHFGFEEFLSSIDIIVQGSRTFIQSISFIESGLVPDLPYKGKHMYVFSHEQRETDRTDVTFISNMEDYLATLDKNPHIKRVWLLGGAQIIELFKEYDLIDECIITVIPKTLHEGIALPSNLFDGMSEKTTRHYAEDIIERKYIRNNE